VLACRSDEPHVAAGRNVRSEALSTGVRGAAKAVLIPHGVRVRRMPFGIGCGIKMPFDLQVQSRIFLGLYEIELNRHLRRMVVPGHRLYGCRKPGRLLRPGVRQARPRAVVTIDADRGPSSA
jgi:hypothetical protein